MALGRPRTDATERLGMSLPRCALKLLEMEAKLVGLERSSFVRFLIARGMGVNDQVRPSRAPKRRPFTAAADRTGVQFITRLSPAHVKWLETMTVKTGGIPKSTILMLLLLDWVGIGTTGTA